MKRNIYICRNWSEYNAFLCRGCAIDECRRPNDIAVEKLEYSEKRMREAMNSKGENMIYKLLFLPKIKNSRRGTIEKPLLINYRDERLSGHECCTSWFLSLEAAQGLARQIFPEDGYVAYMTIYLDLEIYEPLRFPTKVNIFKRSEKDQRLCAKINTHPEVDGLINKGKFFFPDPSWKDVVEGPANVSLVYELSNYGFIIGKPAKLENVLEENLIGKFVSYLQEEKKARFSYVKDETNLKIVNSPIRGRYLYVQGINTFNGRREPMEFCGYFTYEYSVGPEKPSFSMVIAPWVVDDAEKYMERSMTVAEFLLEHK